MKRSRLAPALLVPTLLVPTLLLLAACQPQAPGGEPAPPPADAPVATLPAPSADMDLSKPITAHGTEPFWALNIDGKAFKLTRPDYPDLIAEAPGATIAEGRAIWIAKTADDQQMTVTLYASECSDGMSDRLYPLTAEVVMLNESLRGCATKTAPPPRAAQPK